MKFDVQLDSKIKLKVWLRLLLILIVCLPLWGVINANDSQEKSVLSAGNTALEKCTSGIYKGLQADKTYFTKDPWLWVVTPEFANRFCMPHEFVSNELKGAEAVAFRILDKSDTENCQLKDKKILCFSAKDFRFEIYQKSNAKLPKLHNNDYFQKSSLPSAKLLNASSKEWYFLSKIANQRNEKALSPHFEMKQVGLYATAEEWTIGQSVFLEETTFVASAFDGLDFYAFEASSGFFSKPEVLQNKSKRFSILYKPLSKDAVKSRNNQTVASMGYSLVLPQVFTDQVAAVDREFGFKLPK